jgi:hypothetical protein
MWISPDYQTLAVAQKAAFVWQHGTYLMCRCKGNYAITLHALAGYFIEVWLDATQKRVTMLYCFQRTDQLKPYLEKLPLPALSSTDNKTVE